MAFPSTSQCFFFLPLLVLIAASPIQIQARESRFFSKVTRPEPEPKPEAISPVSSPAKEATPEKGYGLYAQDEKRTYQYSPTTADPTRAAAGAFEYVRPSGGDVNDNGYRHERQGMSDTRFLENERYFHDISNEEKAEGNGKLVENNDGHGSYLGNSYRSEKSYTNGRYGGMEKQGMSDTRFLENGRYFHDISNEEKAESNGKLVEDNDGHESYFGNSYRSEKSYSKNGGYGGTEKQGMSDTRFLENGRYFYDVEAEKRNANDVVFNYNNDENVNGQEEEEENQKYDVNRAYRTGENQGMTGTRFSDNGRYFYGANGEKNQNYENGESFEPGKVGYRGYEGERYSNGEAEGRKYGANGNGYDFRGTPNKFPKHEFDSMEEYEKYEQSKNQMRGYGP